MYPFPHRSVNHFAHSSKLEHNIPVRKSQYRKTLLLQISRTHPVIIYSFRFAMLGTIQLYNQLCLIAIKVRIILTNLILSFELDRIGFQKIVPQMALFLGHIFPQILSTSTHSLYLFHRRNSFLMSPHPPLRGTFPQGKAYWLFFSFSAWSAVARASMISSMAPFIMASILYRVKPTR